MEPDFRLDLVADLAARGLADRLLFASDLARRS
jgi:hypothetical protein